jgi:hypothetical protein
MSETAKTTRAKSAEAPERDGPKAADVAKYLREHPDFFVRHERLLEAMTPPKRWTGDAIVDMQKFVLDNLRGEIEALRRDALEMIETTRGNMSSQTRVHAGVLALVEAADFERLTQAIGDDLPLLLDVDVVTVGFEPAAADGSPAPVGAHLHALKTGAVDAVFGPERQVVLLGDVTGSDDLFGAATGLVRSAALARLRPGTTMPAGILALGSRTNTFEPGQGTELVVFLARVVETCLKRCLEKAA